MLSRDSVGNESYDIPCTSTLCMTRGPNTVQLEYNPKQGIAESILRPKKHHRTILAKAMYGYVWRNKCGDGGNSQINM